MDQIKKLLSPGSTKDDEVLYGNEEARRKASVGNAEQSGTSGQNVEPLRTTDDSTAHSSGGVLRQILNPGGEKYDEQAYGENATTAPTDPKQMQTLPEHQKDHTVLGQILNPGGDKYDETRFGETGATGGVGAAGAGAYAATRDDKDSTSYGQTSSHTPSTARTTYPQLTSEYTPQTTSNDNNLSRDAGIAGVGTAGTAAYASAQHNDPYDGVLDRPHPLSNRGADAHINPVSAPELPETQADSHLGRDAAIVGGTGLAGGVAASELHGSSNPIGGTSAGTYRPDPDRAMGTGPIDVGSASTGTQQTGVGGGQLNQAPADVQNATYTERTANLGTFNHTHGPHVTDIANRLDPHVPGEFPTETGEDRHGLTGQSSNVSGLGPEIGAGSVNTPSAAATSHTGGASYPVQADTTAGTSAPSQAQSTQPEHHYGRDAALGGAGVAGAGAAAYGLSEHERSRQAPEQSTTATASQTYPSQTLGGTGATSSSTPAHTQAAQPQSEHHYGRDAALAGGAGVAGLGAYEATQSHGSAGPASQTAGTYGQPSQQTTPSSTAGASQADQSKHEKGKDAALLAGGAGAGAAATYGASQVMDEKEQKKLEKQHQKELEKEHKEAEKDARKQEKQHQKEIAKEEKKHEKEVAKQEKQHEKEVAKQEKQHEKEADKEREKREKEAAAAGVTGAGAAGAYEAEKHHDSSEQGRSSYDTNETGHSGERKRGLLDKILHPTRKSEDDNRVAADEDGHNKLHKKHAPKASEHTGEGSVTEPHTGLPMNVERYGSGAGGTDGSQTVEGYHEHPTATTGEQSAATGPDWNAIKKENTPY